MDAQNMAGGNKPTPLFEVIRNAEKRDKMILPPWAKPKVDAAAPQEATTADAKPASGFVASLTAGLNWLQNPATMRLPRLAVAGLAVALLSVGLLTGWLIHRASTQELTAQQQSYATLTQPLEALREKQPTAGLISPRLEGVRPETVLPGVGPGAGSVGAPPIKPGHVGDDPRQPGLNYFRLTVLPVSSTAEAERLVGFLGQNGVDAAIIPMQNGRSLKVVALPGFNKPLGEGPARAFELKLKTLGRQWKSQQKGTSDWKDLFPEKYLPTKN
jgi:hypothetical protein